MVDERKNRYQQMISIYVRRRADLRKKYSVKVSYKAPPEYIKKARKINTALGNWRRQIRRIEKKERRIQDISDKMREFSGWGVRRAGGRLEKDKRIWRDIFCKYCMQNGIKGATIAHFCGMKNRRLPAEYRVRLARSFKTNKENLEMWHRFLNFMRENIDTNIDKVSMLSKN